MAEYLLLATFITVLSVSTVWIVRTLQKVGKACYQAILPSRRGEIKKPFFAEETLPTLSEKLATIPMPWGWHALRLPNAPVVSRILPRPPVTIPWGWPGSSMSVNGHIPVRNGAADSVLNGRHANHAGFLAPTREATEQADDLPLGIRRAHSGGYYLVTAGQGPLSDARLPWGW